MPERGGGSIAETGPAMPPALQFYGFDDAVFEVALHEPGTAPSVPEAFVHDLWRHQHFDARGLETTAGQPVQVLSPGRPNAHSGPDFRGARLRLGGLLWSGDVEIHTTSGAWYEHAHHQDARYDGVVLHVTLLADHHTGRLTRADGTVLPEVVLMPRLRAPLHRLVHAFRRRPAEALPCAWGWAEVPLPTRRAWLAHLASERLLGRVQHIETAAQALGSATHWLYERVFAALGYAPNAEAMATLARRLPLAHLQALDHADREALLLGTAGLLPTPAALLDADRATAAAALDRQARYDRLVLCDPVDPLPASAWQFFRLRPANFPTVRLGQAAALFEPGGLLHPDGQAALRQAMMAARPLAALLRLLQRPPLPFWANHVRLVRRSAPRRAEMGRDRARAVVANALLPFLAYLAHRDGDRALGEAVHRVMEALPAEDDAVVRCFASLGEQRRRLPDTQALHQLYQAYCRPGRCLSCAVGQHLLGLQHEPPA